MRMKRDRVTGINNKSNEDSTENQKTSILGMTRLKKKERKKYMYTYC